jgi:hypothetical protein
LDICFYVKSGFQHSLSVGMVTRSKSTICHCVASNAFSPETVIIRARSAKSCPCSRCFASMVKLGISMLFLSNLSFVFHFHLFSKATSFLSIVIVDFQLSQPYVSTEINHACDVILIFNTSNK